MMQIIIKQNIFIKPGMLLFGRMIPGINSYDANNNLIDNLYQTWDISVWKNNTRYLYTYNTNNDPIEYLYQTWNVSVWENNSKSTLTYDSNNNNTEQLS